MIKFFRKIRQNLLSEGKTGKYLKYAIGEILLVVIGILIALQINNWNEINKNKDSEKEYLFRIQSDINQDITELEGHFKTDTLKLDSYTFLGRWLNSDSIKATPEVLLEHLSKANRLNWFEGKNIVFDDMKSSGKTALIVSDTLRNEIQNYYRLFDEVIKQESLYTENIIRYREKIDFLELGPFMEMIMPKRWNANTVQVTANDLFNKLSSLEENKKNILSENFSITKGQIIDGHTIRLKLFEEGIKLTKSIDDYLK